MREQIILDQEVAKILDRNTCCAFATVEGNKPKQRYMELYNQGLSIHLVTDRRTHKVEELEANPYVSLLLGYESGHSGSVVEIEGICKITLENELRARIWNPRLESIFSGPDDPNYVILNIKPHRIEYTDREGRKKEWIE